MGNNHFVHLRVEVVDRPVVHDKEVDKAQVAIRLDPSLVADAHEVLNESAYLRLRSVWVVVQEARPVDQHVVAPSFLDGRELVPVPEVRYDHGIGVIPEKPLDPDVVLDSPESVSDELKGLSDAHEEAGRGFVHDFPALDERHVDPEVLAENLLDASCEGAPIESEAVGQVVGRDVLPLPALSRHPNYHDLSSSADCTLIMMRFQD
jgi:hypothetical protein